MGSWRMSKRASKSTSDVRQGVNLTEIAQTETCGSDSNFGFAIDGNARTIAGLCFLLITVTPALAQSGSAEGTGVPVAAPGGWLEAVLFYFLGGGAILSGLGVCVSRNIVRMATWLFVALGMVAMLYFLLAATFLGAIQLIVYAGGTLVLLVFGVMLTSKSPWVRFECGALELISAGAVCGLLLGCLVAVLTAITWQGAGGAVPGASVADIGRRLFTQYLVPFEVAGVLLFVVMVGAAHLSRQQVGD